MASDKIVIIRRDDHTLTVTFEDSNGDAINITGYTVFFTAKTNENDADADAVISKTVTTHTNPTSGVTAITLSDTDTNIDPGIYLYDLQIKDGSGNITSADRGTFEVVQDITQRTS